MLKKIILLLSFMLFFSNYIVFSQDDDDLVETSYGEIVSISKNTIVIKEYDYDNFRNVNINYVVDENVDLVNFNSLDELKKGDSVDIDYIVKGKTRIAVTIILTNNEDIDDDNRIYNDE
jgi:hypothetical protein